MSKTILILTTAHWSGDPRLNRHVAYLGKHSVPAELISLESSKSHRTLRLARALRIIWTQRPHTVILPDPELFVLGSLLARLRGVRAVLDIHEDYSKVVEARDWIPRMAKPIVRTLLRANDTLGRKLADISLVAAEELQSPGSVLVRNIPNPDSFDPSTPDFSEPKVVYVGDVTTARGAIEMANVARRLPQVRVMIVGRVDDALKEKMLGVAGPDAILEFTGRLSHERAWKLVRGAVAGLSLLRPLPAYEHAVATKLWEYCASGIPPVVSSLPGQTRFVNQLDPSLSIDSDSEAAQLIKRLIDDPQAMQELSRAARKLAAHSWDSERPDLALYEAVTPRPITRS